MKITIQFDEDGKESQIPFEAKLTILKRIMKAAHNPVEFVTFDVQPFKTSDKQ